MYLNYTLYRLDLEKYEELWIDLTKNIIHHPYANFMSTKYFKQGKYEKLIEGKTRVNRTIVDDTLEYICKRIVRDTKKEIDAWAGDIIDFDGVQYLVLGRGFYELNYELFEEWENTFREIMISNV